MDIFEQLRDERRQAKQAAAAVHHAAEHVGAWFHHADQAPSPNTSAVLAAAIVPTPTMEGHSPEMLEELKHLLDLADEASLHAINAVLTHPEGLAVLSDVAAVAGIHCPPGTITSAASGLKAVLLVAGQHVDASTTPPNPAAPQA